VYLPLGMLVAAGAYSYYMVEDERVRSIIATGFGALVALPIAVHIVV